QALALLADQPGVGDVAVEAGHEEQQQEAQLVDLAAVVLAGQAVGQLVQGGDGEQHQPGQGQRLPADRPRQVVRRLLPVRRQHHAGGGHQGQRQQHERPREQERRRRRQGAGQRVGVAEAAPPVQDALAGWGRGGRRRRRRGGGGG